MKAIGRMVSHLVASTANSLRGLAVTFRQEMAFRQEVFLAVPHFCVLYFMGFPPLSWLALSVLLAIVWVAELLNTAVENVVDLASPGYHELAKRAKDAASAAVGICLIVYVVAWGFAVYVQLTDADCF